jgi:hypothetical protein
MNPLLVLRTAAFSLALLLLATGAQAAALTRVARLGFIEGEVSFLEAGDADWVQASLNRPLTTGDQLWTDSGAASEIQLEGATVRMGGLSNLTVLNLDERITQLQLSQGAVRLRVRALGPQQSIEVDTPNLAMVLRRTGDYRIEVDPSGDSTLVLVQSGQAEILGDGASFRVDSNRAYRFFGTNLSDYEAVSNYRADDLDRWAEERERRLGNSASARYVPAGVVGYEDLDANGRWVVDANFGNVWLPSRVDAGWTPYRDGSWAWVAPWGWTWIDDAPWGYAVSHYGRWSLIGNAWGWVPGAARERVVYAPALVVFVGANQSRNPPERRAGMGNTSWFPLGPRDIYRPGQAPAREGYANQHVRGAVVAPANQPRRERAPDAEARSRPPKDNHPIAARTAPSTLSAPAVAPAAAPLPTKVPPPAPRSEASRGERGPERARPAALPAATIAAPVAAEPARSEPPKSETARSKDSRDNAAKADASRADAQRAKDAKDEVGRNAARAERPRAEQAKPKGRNSDAQPGNAKRPDRELTPEEELLLRGRHKQ